MSEKTRDLTRLEYFEQLQLEYLVAELRGKIYPSVRDKKYYRERVMPGKRHIIEEIAFRNNLPSIFTSQQVLRDFYQKIYAKPFPLFLYRSNEERERLFPQDFENYYSSGEFMLIDKPEVFGLIVSHDDSYVILNTNQGENLRFPINKVRRIL